MAITTESNPLFVQGCPASEATCKGGDPLFAMGVPVSEPNRKEASKRQKLLTEAGQLKLGLSFRCTTETLEQRVSDKKRELAGSARGLGVSGASETWSVQRLLQAVVAGQKGNYRPRVRGLGALLLRMRRGD